MIWIDTVVQGILLGGLYALFAAGLSLMFGIMRLVNLAHGDLIVLAAYLILIIVTMTGLSPFVAVRKLPEESLYNTLSRWSVAMCTAGIGNTYPSS